MKSVSLFLLFSAATVAFTLQPKCDADEKSSTVDTSDWPKSPAFPTEFVVTSYSKDVPDVGELQGIFRRLADAQKEVQRLRSLPSVAKADVTIDPGTDDAFPKRAEKLVRAVKHALGEGVKDCNRFVENVSQNYDESKKLMGTANEIAAYLKSDQSRQAGWFDVRTIGKVEGKDAITMATTLANQGFLVIGAISADVLNMNRPEGTSEYEHGHVFIVFPSEIGGWHGALVGNAGTGNSDEQRRGQILPSDQVTTSWQRPLYSLFAIHE